MRGAPDGFYDVTKTSLNPGRSPWGSHAHQQAKAKVLRSLVIILQLRSIRQQKGEEEEEEEPIGSTSLEI